VGQSGVTCFDHDNAWQRERRDRFLVPFYERWADGSKYVLIDKGRCASIVQRRIAADTVATHRKATWFIEEKICRQPFPNFFLETDSCTTPGKESQGWMHYGEADLLFYCFADDPEDTTLLDAYLIDFQKLKQWFWPLEETWESRTVSYTLNHSRGRIVPRQVLHQALCPLRFTIRGNGQWQAHQEQGALL
jgi:hypothetical protein